jgi:hypothetical protein
MGKVHKSKRNLKRSGEESIVAVGTGEIKASTV